MEWGGKAENFQINFLIWKKTLLYEYKLYQKKKNFNVWGGEILI